MNNLTEEKPVPILKDNYLAMVEGSVGSEAFRHFYAIIGGEKRDITKKGRLSCAYFVSSILKIFNLISGLHLTVTGTVKDLKRSGWIMIGQSRAPRGAVIVWESVKDQNESHRHIGFCLGRNLAVSNDSKTGKIAKHHLTFQNKRRIESIWQHKAIL